MGFDLKELNEEIASDFDALSMRYGIRKRLNHFVKKVEGEAYRHIFEFGTVRQGGVVLEVLLYPNRHIKRSMIVLGDMQEKGRVYLQLQLDQGDNTQLFKRIHKIFRALFEGLDDEESIPALIDRLKRLHRPKRAPQLQERIDDEVLYSASFLEYSIAAAQKKGAPLIGWRYSPNRRVVVIYQRAKWRDERFFLSMKEAILHIRASYALRTEIQSV